MIETMKFLPFIAVTISLISLFISILSFHRTKQIQDYEYLTRLQIFNEEVKAGHPSRSNQPALSYKATIENRGSKPIKIAKICIDYGDYTDTQKRIKYHVIGENYLRPGQTISFSKEITWKDIDEMKKRYNIDHCTFFLRTAYYTLNNDLKETTRKLLTFKANGIIFYAQKGNSIT